MSNKKLTELFDNFIKQQEYVAKISPETLRGYRTTFRLFTKLIGSNLAPIDLTEDIMVDFFSKIGKNQDGGRPKDGPTVKNSTVATYRSKLNKFFEWLVTRDEIKQNPLKNIPYPIVNYDDKQWLDKEDVEKIRTSIELKSKNLFLKKRNLAMLGVLLFCGLRRNELISLRIFDINLEKKMLTVNGITSKSKRQRIVPLNNQVIEYLKDYLKELKSKKDYKDQYLWASDSRNHRLTPNGLKHLVKTLRIRSSVKFHIHQCRHTFAMNTLIQGTDVAKLKQLLGHQDIRMTATYLRHIPSQAMADDLNKVNYNTIY